MKPLVLVVFALAALPVLAETDDSARPKSPGVKWVEATVKLVELVPSDAALKIVPAFPIPAAGDGRFLFGPTPGYDVKVGGGGFVIQPRTEDESKADPIQVKGSGRRFFPFVYGSSDVRSYGNYVRAAAVAPFRRALDAPMESHTENPEPYPVQPRPGPFISVIFPLATKATMKEGTIRPRGGEPLKCDWTDPAHPPEKAKQRFPDNDACIVLIPLLALKPDTMYDVKIVARVGDKDETYAWSFRTRSAK